MWRSRTTLLFFSFLSLMSHLSSTSRFWLGLFLWFLCQFPAEPWITVVLPAIISDVSAVCLLEVFRMFTCNTTVQLKYNLKTTHHHFNQSIDWPTDQFIKYGYCHSFTETYLSLYSSLLSFVYRKFVTNPPIMWLTWRWICILFFKVDP